MNAALQQDDNDAWFSRNDRFDGFDRGDAGYSYDDELQAQNEAWEADARAEARSMGLTFEQWLARA